MLATTTEEEFANLPAAGNGILQGRPNHILINRDLLLMASCVPSFRSSSLATMKIIDFVRIINHNEWDEEDDETDDEDSATLNVLS
jgi:hypothetical protein